MLSEVGFDNFIKLPLPNRRVLRKLFKKYDLLTIFDIGSCEAEDSIRYAKFFPNCTVHSFEPVENNYKIGLTNIKRHRLQNRIILNKTALSNSNGTATIHISSGRPENVNPTGDWDYGNKSSSLLKPNEALQVTPWLKFSSKTKVKTQKLASYCDKANIKKIDLIHMDVQGAEKMVLEGAGKMLRSTSAIWLEVESIELYKNQVLKPEIEKFMHKNDFIKVADTVDSISGDQLYIKRSLEIETKDAKLSFKAKAFARKNKLLHLKPDDMRQDIFVPSNHAWMFSENFYYEANLVYWFEKSLNYLRRRQKDIVFFDIGSNSGYYSLISSEVCSKVYAFEPSKRSAKIIKHNLKVNKVENVEIINLGLGVKDETLLFHSYSSSGNDSFVKRNIPVGHELKYRNSKHVKIRSMDTLIKSNGLKYPNIMKIDVEGLELFVLKGGVDSIKASLPIIIVEYSQSTSKDAGYNKVEIPKFLESLGYKIFGISSDNKTIELSKQVKNDKLEKYTNILALPNSVGLEDIL